MEINLIDKILVNQDKTNHKHQTFHIPCNFFDILPDMSFVLDASYKILHCNKAAAQFFSASKNEMVSKNFIELISEEKREEFKKVFDKSINEGLNQEIESVFVAGEKKKFVQVILSPFFQAGQSNNNIDERLCFCPRHFPAKRKGTRPCEICKCGRIYS